MDWVVKKLVGLGEQLSAWKKQLRYTLCALSKCNQRWGTLGLFGAEKAKNLKKEKRGERLHVSMKCSTFPLR